MRHLRSPTLFCALLSVLFFPGFDRRRPGSLARWGPDRPLTRDSGVSHQLSFNFAWSVAADAFGRVHVVWYDDRDGNPQIYYKRSEDDGGTWGPDTRLSVGPGPNEHPAVAVSGSNVYVVWHGIREGGSDIFLRHSRDGGASFDPVTPMTSRHSSAHASVAASGSAVHIVWADGRDGQAEIYTRRSADAGESWEEEKRLTDHPSTFGTVAWVPTVAVSGANVYVAWVDTRDGNEEEYFKRSTDGGASWGPDTRLTEDRANSWAPSLAVSGDTVHLVWFDQKDSPAQPLEAEEKLDGAMRVLGLAVESVPAGVMVPHPEYAARRRAGEKLHLILEAAPAWVQRGGDATALRRILQELEELGRAGASYLEKERKLDQAVRLLALSYKPGPADDLPKIYYMDAMRLRVADKMKQIEKAAPGWVAQGGDPMKLEALLKEFERTMSLATTEWEIYYRRSTDGGATWGPETRLTNAPGPSQRPSLAVVGDRLHTVWFDGRDGNAELYYKHSEDGGETWGSDIRLTNAPGDSLNPSVAVSGSHVHVVWFDRRDGNAEIYYKRR